MKKSVIFNQTPRAKVRRSAFDLSHEKKLSFSMGQLIPVLCQEVVPGDKFKIDSQTFIRFAPMVAPVMHRINAYVHFFFVPNRIIWDDWEEFITGEQNITTPGADALPQISPGDIGDYLGLPVNFTPSKAPGDPDYNCHTLPIRAYVKIFNDYYRDEDLIPEVDIEALEVSDYASLPLYRAWEKDYFTSARPWAQKGDPVTVPVNIDYLGQSHVLKTADGSNATDADLNTSSGHLGSQYDNLRLENIEDANVDINELRTAQRLQRWLERNARAGSRYVEHLLAHWGIVSDDARLQRAEYIGGGKSPVVISEVLNMSSSEDPGTTGEPVGTMYGHGINVGQTNTASKYCKEHGYIMGILSVIPEPGYAQGMPKMFTRNTNLDFYFPEFAQLGEQVITQGELFYTGAPANDLTEFGYQSRYAEYKFNPNTVHGEFRVENSLDAWSLHRVFENAPTLNADFVRCIPSTRIFALDDAPASLYCQIYHKITAVRPMPYFNVPGL